MLLDLSLPLRPENFCSLAPTRAAALHVPLERFGHLGTHLDLMGQTWPQANFLRQGRVFDLRHVRGRDVGVGDLPCADIAPGTFIFLRTGVLEAFAYGSEAYAHAPVQLSWNLLEALTHRRVAMIGVDCAGVRLPAEHKKADDFCAAAGTFVVENVYNLAALCDAAGAATFAVRTFPLRLEESTGLPCRIMAELPSA